MLARSLLFYFVVTVSFHVTFSYTYIISSPLLKQSNYYISNFSRNINYESRSLRALFNHPTPPRSKWNRILQYFHEEPKQTFTSARYSRPRYRRISVKDTAHIHCISLSILPLLLLLLLLPPISLIPPARDNGHRSKHVIG